MSHLILLSGTPSAGKSTFSRWLEGNRGFRRFEFDKNERMRQWIDGFILQRRAGAKPDVLTRGAENFVQSLRQDSEPVVFEWGFKPEHIETVKLLIAAGFKPVFLRADPVQARASFVADYGEAAGPIFDAQRDRITAGWQSIVATIPTIIETLDASGVRMPHDELARRLGL